MTLRALGGGKLAGENLSRFIYLDESGISGRRYEPWLVVGGLLVHGDTQLNKLYAAIEAATERHLLARHLESGVVFHAGDIYGGNGKFDEGRDPHWTEERRFAILEDLAKIPEKANILITGALIEMERFSSIETPISPEDSKRLGDKKSRPPSLAVQAQAVCYLVCLLEVDIWMRKNRKNENCMVIVEDNNEARSVIRQVHRYHQSRFMTLPPDLKDEFPLRRIREDPSFQWKSQNHPLVLADFVAFVLKRVSMKDPKIGPFYNPWKKRYEALVIGGAKP